MKQFIILLLISLFLGSCEKINIASSLQKGSIIAMTDVLHEYTEETDAVLKGSTIVFIAGFDEGDSAYYAQASSYFKNKNLKVVEGLYSLEEIIAWLNAYENKLTEIHIVSHSNPWRGMALQTKQEGPRITQETLQQALAERQWPKAPENMDENTHIIFHSCGLGNNTPLLSLLQKVFSNSKTPQVLASPYFNVFGGKYAAHYIARPYYVFYPTAHSPGPLALAQEMRTSYPNKKIDWFTALKTREETTIGTPYSYRFNIPVTWQFEFETVSDIPSLEAKNDIKAFIQEDPAIMEAMAALEIPIDTFRWQTKVRGNILTIHGKTTVLSVLEPVMNEQDSGAYLFPEATNRAIYTIL
jgi:hypothetical protein